ncbi:hypothetical protein CALCODRAFT_511490 [Calocera cornea HHB12733]|uniref:Uncharacterized protein n=1 Tax=Calocera cornea HHB12733 TaxID=1353952 RepID=A0A165DR09_9BASI|nr:hypothetical protein CALCODRAFT_511490 [Calocera cornea HHB12733]
MPNCLERLLLLQSPLCFHLWQRVWEEIRQQDSGDVFKNLVDLKDDPLWEGSYVYMADELVVTSDIAELQGHCHVCLWEELQEQPFGSNRSGALILPVNSNSEWTLETITQLCGIAGKDFAAHQNHVTLFNIPQEGDAKPLNLGASSGQPPMSMSAPSGYQETSTASPSTHTVEPLRLDITQEDLPTVCAAISLTCTALLDVLCQAIPWAFGSLPQLLSQHHRHIIWCVQMRWQALQALSTLLEDMSPYRLDAASKVHWDTQKWTMSGWDAIITICDLANSLFSAAGLSDNSISSSQTIQKDLETMKKMDCVWSKHVRWYQEHSQSNQTLDSSAMSSDCEKLNILDKFAFICAKDNATINHLLSDEDHRESLEERLQSEVLWTVACKEVLKLNPLQKKCKSWAKKQAPVVESPLDSASVMDQD